MRNEHLRSLLTEQENVLANRMSQGAGYPVIRPSQGDVADCLFPAFSTSYLLEVAREKYAYTGNESRAAIGQYLRLAGVKTLEMPKPIEGAH